MAAGEQKITEKHAVVLGAGGGLGRALYTQLSNTAQYTRVIGISRQAIADNALPESAWYQADVTCQEDIARVVETLVSETDRVDLLINASGMLHRADERPEKSLRELAPASFEELMRVNALAPLMALQQFVPLLRRSAQPIAVALSAMVGSISDNRLGGWYSYRMSKAALNMGLKTASIELARHRNAPTVVAIHPGTTLTSLSHQFVQRHQPRSPRCSARRILAVIDSLGPQDTGKFFNWDGRELPW